MSAEIKPYRIAVRDDVLDDLKSRLRNTRWPEAELVEDWSQGAPLKWIKDICRYWAEEYDWRAREAGLNGLHSSPPKSTGSTFISCTSARRIQKPCR